MKKTRTYVTQEEINEVLSDIVPNNRSVGGYTREEQIGLASEVVRRTGKSIRINAMTIHPSTPISFGEKLYRAAVNLAIFFFVVILIMGCLIAVIGIGR
jgi:hypothetical protein